MNIKHSNRNKTLRKYELIPRNFRRLKTFRISSPEVFCKKKESTCATVWHRYFPVNFAKVLKTPVFIEHVGRLLLNFIIKGIKDRCINVLQVHQRPRASTSCIKGRCTHMSERGCETLFALF